MEDASLRHIPQDERAVFRSAGCQRPVRAKSHSQYLDFWIVTFERAGHLPTLQVPQSGDAAFRSEKIPGFSVEILPADGTKCERCWNYTTDVGGDADYPGTCARCARAVREILSYGEPS